MSEKHRPPSGARSVWWREVTVVGSTLLVSVLLIGAFHYNGDPAWVGRNLGRSAGADIALWQVQTTFLSVGFAGLTIAAQLFAETPLAIGTSRKRILSYIGAGWFVTMGLAANALMAVEAIWLPSATGVVIAFAWFVATASLLLVSTSRLTRLFGHPSRLDEVVRSSLVETLSDRVEQVSRRYTDGGKVGGLLASEPASGTSTGSSSTLTVPVPEAGRIVRAVRPKAVRQAIASLGVPAVGRAAEDRGTAEDYVSPRILLDVHAGYRTRLGDTAFRVVTPSRLDRLTTTRVVRLLQSSLEWEPRGAVTPFEETEHEIATLKDAIGTNLRAGAMETAERALELLGHIVRGAWMTDLDREHTARRQSVARGSGLVESIGEVEQDVLLSPQAAHVFVSAATVRALEAPETGSPEYVDVCFRSFTRLWSEILLHGGPEFQALPVRIIACVQNLIAYPGSPEDGAAGFRSRGVWTMVELVKLALDAGRPEPARVAAGNLRLLSDADPEDADVRAGLLVLSGWLGYLAGTDDPRAPADPGLEATLRSGGSPTEILAARDLLQRGAGSNHWGAWEAGGTETAAAPGAELSGYIDRAQLTALTGSSGSLPEATDQRTASEYGRLLGLIPDAEGAAGGDLLRDGLEAEIGRWEAGESDRRAREPLWTARVELVGAALREALDGRERLAELLPADPEEPPSAPGSRPILGVDVLVPRGSFVEGASEEDDADPGVLGRMIADAVTEAEDRRVVTELRALQPEVLGPAAPGLRQAAAALRDAARELVLLTPYGGLVELRRQYPADLRDELDRVRRIETGALDGEAILFDPRTTLLASRAPAEGEGRRAVAGTAIALGVFEDDGSRTRVEAAESFRIRPGEGPFVFRFGEAAGDAQRR